MRVLLLITVTLASCARLSPSVKTRLRAPQGFMLVRAPTPMTGVREAVPNAMDILLRLPPSQERVTQINVTSFAGAGAADPADLFMIELAHRLNKLGYTPNMTANVSVRFESIPERWPEETGIKSEWVLHAQVDEVKLDGAQRPKILRGSATLFNGERVLRTTCLLRGEWTPSDGPQKAWTTALKECTDDLLIPFEDEK